MANIFEMHRKDSKKKIKNVSEKDTINWILKKCDKSEEISGNK